MKYKNNFNLFVLTLFLLGAYPDTYAQDYTLPTYYLEIETEHLDALNVNSYSDVYYPAVFIYNEIDYECEVKFRGGTSRNLPKKSWRVKFSDSNNILMRKR